MATSENVVQLQELSVNYIGVLRHSLTTFLSEMLPVDAIINVKKRNKKLKEGDFVATVISKSTPCNLSSLVRGDQVNIRLAPTCEVKISQFQMQNGKLFVALERNSVIEKLIGDVLKIGNSYGHFLDQSSTSVLLVNPILVGEGIADVTLECLRSVLIFLHVCQLLKANGFQVFLPPSHERPKQEFTSLWPALGVELEKVCFSGNSCSTKVELHGLKTEFIHSLSGSQYCTERTGQRQNADHDQFNVELTTVDCTKYLSDKNLTGRYSKNIKAINFHAESAMVEQIVLLEQCKRRNLAGIDQNMGCLHVVPKVLEYQEQIVDLGWTIYSGDHRFLQKHVVCNTVSVQKCDGESKLPTLKDFILLHEQQMKEAFESKYGENVASSEYKAQIDQLTLAAIKFDFLLSSHSNVLKLDVQKPSTKGGVFVMYNYARLATLFAKFDKGVSEGMYPHLPQSDGINWSLLKEEEEWELLFNFVIMFPTVLQDSVISIFTDVLKPAVQTHALCQFLQDLCFCLSSYYNRVHILTEPYSHLLPMMYARIYLLKSVKQVLYNGLALLKIEPFEEL